MKIIMNPRRYISVALLSVALAPLSGCLPKKPVATEPHAVVEIEGRDDEFRATCNAVFVSELGREPDAGGAAECLARCRRGETGAQLVEWVRTASDEYATRQEQLERERAEREARRPKLRGRLRAEGTRIVDAAGADFHAVFVSGLTLLVRTPPERAAFLDELVDLGFNGVRVFGGRLTWAGQTPEGARAVLPVLLNETAERGLYVQIAAITDSRGDIYDVMEHVEIVAALTSDRAHVILEVANEPWHPSQRPLVNDLDGLCLAAQRVLADYPNLWALGAGPRDYPVDGRYAGACGPISVAHVGRGGDMLTAALGLGEIARATGRPVLSSEPIGAGEITKPGSRLADPAFFGALAHRLRSMGVGGVFHSEDGLFARPLGPVQRAAAAAYVAGAALAPGPVPPFTPAEPCADASTPAEIVACQRALNGHMSRAELVTFLRAIARGLNARGIDGGGWGVLVKTGGNNCIGYSCDIVCRGDGPAQRQVDVLRDEDGDQAPTWSEVTQIAVRPCEVVR